MPMNNQLLRPRQSGFNPRSISGLALWLDAADSQTLYTTDAGPVAAVSSPLEITANPCLCWYDAADASSVTQSGGLVTQWSDKSGNARHATASGSLRPTHGGSQNGRTVMQFTGTQAMTITGNFLQTDNVTMFAVAMKNTDHFGGIISSAPTNPEDSPILCFYSTTIAWLNRRMLVQQATGNGVYRIVSGQSSGTSQFGWFDGLRGTDTVASAALNTANTITKIGALRTSSTADLNGNIAEIVCYSGNLSTTDRARVEAYLAAKWGISGVHRPVAQEITAVASPLELTDCALWLDADQSVTPSLFDATVGGSAVTAENGTVARWQDKSGNNRHATQAASANRPLFKNSSYNGRSCLNGSGDRFMVCEGANINAPSLTVFAVYRLSQWQTGTAPLDKNQNIYHTDLPASGFATLGLRSEQGSGSMNVRPGDADSSAPYTLTGITSTHQDQTAIQATRLIGSTGAIVSRVSGTQAASATVAGTNLPASFGSRVSVMTGFSEAEAGRRLFGDLAEFIIFRRDLSDTDMQRVEKYLAAKWGIANVPDPTPPVGYWGDKSGNARHATQSTAANRPVIHSATQNNRKILSFDGSNDALLGTGAQALKTGMTLIGAYFAGNVNYASLFCVGDPAAGKRWLSGSSLSKVGIDYYTNALSVQADSRNRTGITSFTFNPSANSLGIRMDGAQVLSQASLSPALAAYTSDTFAVAGVPLANEQWLAGRIFELAVYNRVLSAAECRRVEQALATKWGITLAPQVANADAQDWVNRVYANGGTVSATTASAVNTFCESIDSAGIRDRFYRLNLFCGNSDASLNAVRTPLYRGPSLGGTQFGNATDTNVNFVQGDYAETGAGAGLTGNGSSKFLRTGFGAFAAGLVETNTHMAAYVPALQGAGGGFMSMGALQLPAEVTAWSLSPAYSNNNLFYRSGGTQNVLTASYSAARTGHVLAQRTGAASAAAYHRGVLMSGTVNLAGDAAWTTTNNPGLTAAFARGDGGAFWYQGSLAGYSMGASMTATQVAAYNDAMQAFQTAIGRQA